MAGQIHGSQFNMWSGVKEAKIHAVVTRADGTKEDRGVVAYWHRNPLRRWAWRLGRFRERVVKRIAKVMHRGAPA